jgi:formiminoglutamase
MALVLKMTTPAFSSSKEFPKMHVLGSPNHSLPHFERLEVGREFAASSVKQNKHWIGLGGGHDYGYSDGAGFLDAVAGTNCKPLIINFDAHLDVRPMNKQAITSGTPFSRLLELPYKFEFLEIGVQDFCNSLQHTQWAREKGAKILTLEELRAMSKDGEALLLHRMANILDSPIAVGHPCFLSIDIDVFSSSFAMGCSQSWPSGMTPLEFWPLFRWILQSFDVISMGIYEVSPPLDQGNLTSKLASEIVYRYLQSVANKALTT